MTRLIVVGILLISQILLWSAAGVSAEQAQKIYQIVVCDQWKNSARPVPATQGDRVKFEHTMAGEVSTLLPGQSTDAKEIQVLNALNTGEIFIYAYFNGSFLSGVEHVSPGQIGFFDCEQEKFTNWNTVTSRD